MSQRKKSNYNLFYKYKNIDIWYW